MSESVFSEGVWVRYKTFRAQIRFVCNSYITICIHPNVEKVRQTCLLVYHEDWNKISLLKESEK
jgi:hypothetical protein